MLLLFFIFFLLRRGAKAKGKTHPKALIETTRIKEIKLKNRRVFLLFVSQKEEEEEEERTEWEGYGYKTFSRWRHARTVRYT